MSSYFNLEKNNKFNRILGPNDSDGKSYPIYIGYSKYNYNTELESNFIEIFFEESLYQIVDNTLCALVFKKVFPNQYKCFLIFSQQTFDLKLRKMFYNNIILLAKFKKCLNLFLNKAKINKYEKSEINSMGKTFLNIKKISVYEMNQILKEFDEILKNFQNEAKETFHNY